MDEPSKDTADVSIVKGPGTRILVVDDDPAMRHLIAEYLESNSIDARLASGPKDLERELALGEPNLIILDVQLGQDDGFDILRKLRSSSDIPVIITTGHRRDEIDRVVGLELGADDYVTKPFSLRELLARIRAVLRRKQALPASTKAGGGPRLYRFGNWELNARTRKLGDPAGAPITLTKGEYALLVAFLELPQRILTREQLLQATRVHEDIFDRSIDVQILRLRRKLEVDPSAPQLIKTERGSGYIFSLPVQMG